jgi:hypothetical protein
MRRNAICSGWKKKSSLTTTGLARDIFYTRANIWTWEPAFFLAPVTRQHPQYKAWSVHDMRKGHGLAQTSPPCHAHHLYDTGTAQRRKYAQMAHETIRDPNDGTTAVSLQTWER